ncbi:M13 family metallopeptidase [Cyclobacterium amurskyense]|uniref:Peptidase, M13 family n=1 Tax=Cyclobacterium amurskyense TaxID=320787 RepID=A0A0H4PPN0_9BACT|nr:M13 family metallopeptidase [Cyclobacterium amurskyense]AKP50222.1 Peptidase, M13 family [Cyclobacterium amurskyense]
MRNLSQITAVTMLVFWTTSSFSQAQETDAAKTQAINKSYMDTSIRPQDDFFRYVNGSWLATTEIPADQGRWGSFLELRELSIAGVKQVMEAAKANISEYPEGSDQYKAIAFYTIGMDSLLAEKRGHKELLPWFDQIDKLKSKKNLQAFIEKIHPAGVSAFFNMYVSSDAKDSDKNALYLRQGGLGLPDRDYYVDESNEKFKEIKAKYEAHISKVFQMLGSSEKEANKLATDVLLLEKKLAAASKTRIEMRDSEGRYNKYSMEELQKATPSLDWSNLTKAFGAHSDEIIISSPDFMLALEEVFSELKPKTWQNYLKWHLVRMASPYLNHDLVQANFDFYGKELQGTEEMRARWKRVLSSAEGAAGEAIGKLYTEEFFPEEAKEKANEMVSNILAAMGNRIQQLDWMSEETKAKAMDKLATFTVKIGYPDTWKSYAALEVNDNVETASYLSNVIAANKFQFKKNMDKLGKEVDRSEWFMTPQTVNAYYNPTYNEIVFPAAILQPPFYNYKADAAVNYGGIGAVIGHEISHGFDDQGSRYSPEGNLENWWKEEDLENFQQRTGQLVAQYDQYEPIEGLKVKGQLTLGENIGDLGGVLVAYDGLQKHLEEHGDPGKIDGFTPSQRFFLSWATVWRTKSREEALRTQIQNDPHSPAQYRANGPLVNVDAFYQAFDVKKGDQMYVAPEERVRIW